MLTNAENLSVVYFFFFTKDLVLYEVWFYLLFHKRFGSFSQKAENLGLALSSYSFLAHSDHSTSQYTLVFKHRLRLKFDDIRLVLKGHS